MLLMKAFDAPEKVYPTLKQAAQRYAGKKTMIQNVLLDKSRYNRNRFNCGVEALNNCLKVMASQQAKKDNTSPFVLEDENNIMQSIGFYTLIMTTKPGVSGSVAK